MKKILFATTALVATASVAAADVSFSGYGRFGVMYSDVGPDGVAGTADDTGSTDITSRLRIQIDATAESDAGVTFGARVRIQQNNNSLGATNNPRFFARSGGLEVGVGNIYGAFESMPGQYSVDMGLTGLGYDAVAYRYGADFYKSDFISFTPNNGVEVMYSAGDFQGHISYSEGSGPTGGDRTAMYGAYTFSGWTVALGYQDSVTTDTEWTATVGGNIGPAAVALGYGKAHNGDDRIVLSGRFDVGASTNIEAYVADDSTAANTGYGIDFNHDLGGGTSIRGGVAKRLSGETRADLGVRFNF